MSKKDSNSSTKKLNISQDRRAFLQKGTLAAMALALGTDIIHAASMPEGYIPVMLPADFDPMKGKSEGMIIRNEKPWNVEPAPHLLNDAITPFSSIFIRNNGLIPEDVDAAKWTLTIGGESVVKEKTYTLEELKKKFKSYTYQLTLECGGNGRAGFYPPASGNQWEEGAVYCSEWTGVRLKDVLADVGIKPDAVYVGYYGTDKHLNGDPNKVVISRGAPMAKALQDETLLAFQLNGKDIPLQHGYPLRLVCGGWPASVSGKWLNKLVVRNQVHDGEKMMGDAYRVPKYPVAPGDKVPDEDMKIIESMPVKSIITYPKSGAMFSTSRKLSVQGHAWAGENEVSAMEVSTDFGATWKKCSLKKPVNRLAWQQWSIELSFPQAGYYEIWAKATDDQGISQPMVIPGWNPKGYLNNACHRIAVKVS
ncbi:sulfite oxidase [Algoriphagus yeomjeoni]|uniref:DMSO/TMAO reductase YedYZ molybdopterin-dependent catalytic subunit n=1 Tax=Algoriphagus yeomjeoni TaxID=291403 RepID=A0A327P8W9_9BACT|nr:sulfite oxidase [Algoriphagus yeomjeoni]RAI87907.1 DMSO/TMAO reductase YedYZ molybdopterin-dependent catalytic subunit [Algoriphagus yeomjeoni]